VNDKLSCKYEIHDPNLPKMKVIRCEDCGSTDVKLKHDGTIICAVCLKRTNFIWKHKKL